MNTHCHRGDCHYNTIRKNSHNTTTTCSGGDDKKICFSKKDVAPTIYCSSTSNQFLLNMFLSLALYNVLQ